VHGAARGAVIGEVAGGTPAPVPQWARQRPAARLQANAAQQNQAAQQQQQAQSSQQAAYAKARSACLEGRGYTVK
jgi:hypothetical protein